MFTAMLFFAMLGLCGFALAIMLWVVLPKRVFNNLCDRITT